MSRPPWMTPVQYNEDRFDEPSLSLPPEPPVPGGDRDEDSFGIEDEDTLESEEDGFQSRDGDPVDYSRGPHEDEFGVDEDAFESNDREPIDYGNGPHDDEFGVDEDEDA